MSLVKGEIPSKYCHHNLSGPIIQALALLGKKEVREGDSGPGKK